MTMPISVFCPFNRKRLNARTTAAKPETHEIVQRMDRLAESVDALGVETRAIAQEAHHVRTHNHFGSALTAAFATPREPRQ